jgi:hypothetical protein
MPWIDGLNWLMEAGAANGLSRQLEQALLSAVTIQQTAANIADLRNEACQFLMDQLSFNDLERLWNRLPWLRDIRPIDSKAGMIRRILEELTGQRIDTLCNALAP